MKTKILIIAVVLVSMMTSCASHCQSDKWRKRRFVQNELPVQAKPIANTTVNG